MSISLILLGIMIGLILFFSLIDQLDREIETWKIKSMIWMAWHYFWLGIACFWMIRGVIDFFHENLLIESI